MPSDPTLATKDAHARDIYALAQRITRRFAPHDPGWAEEEARALALTALALWDTERFRGLLLCTLGALHQDDPRGARACLRRLRGCLADALADYDAVVAQERAAGTRGG